MPGTGAVAGRGTATSGGLPGRGHGIRHARQVSRLAGRQAGLAAGYGRATVLAGRRLGCPHAHAVVDEPGDALIGERAGVLVSVHRQVRRRVAADRVQHSAVVLGHDLHVAMEEHPVARLGGVAVPERAPPAMGMRVLQYRDHAGRRRVGIYPPVHPRMDGPGVGRAAGHPTLLAGELRPELQGEAGERRARRAVIGAVGAGMAPDHRLHLGRTPGLGQAQEMLGVVHDRRSEHAVAARRHHIRPLEGDQPGRQAGW